jgi:hypothetical protein
MNHRWALQCAVLTARGPGRYDVLPRRDPGRSQNATLLSNASLLAEWAEQQRAAAREGRVSSVREELLASLGLLGDAAEAWDAIWERCMIFKQRAGTLRDSPARRSLPFLLEIRHSVG